MNNLPIGDILLWFVVFLFSLSFHESAHAWTSERFGDDTGRLQGRITLNPIPHIDPIGTLLLPIMGFLSGGLAMFGWAKPVQTNPLLWRNKTKANIMVSAAGPISNFILATVAFIVLKVMLVSGIATRPTFMHGGPFSIVVPAAGQPDFMMPITTLVSIMLILNITLGVFNLIPIPPLDGSHIFEELLPPDAARAYEQIRPYSFILLVAVLWIKVGGQSLAGWIIQPFFKLAIFLLYGS
jgi:Zn-dependent protease